MSGVDRWSPGFESVNGVSPLVLAGAALAVAVVLVALVLMARGRKPKSSRKTPLVPAPVPIPKQSETSSPSMSNSRTSSWGFIWPATAVLASLAIALIVIRPGSDPSSALRSLDARSAELTMRVLTPGSPLACLDAVGSVAVEASCEKTLFSSPETLAAAIAYVDARLSLFVEGSEIGRNSAAGDSFERLRRTIETDRYGLVAHVLTTRGCDADNCPPLKLLRDPAQVLANLRDRTFDANVVLHAASWRSDASSSFASAPAAGPALASAPTPMPTVSGSMAPAAPTPSSPSKFEFPSSASIPAVSIMNAEPSQPPAAAKAEQPPSAAKPAPSRRQSARETTSQSPTPAPGPPVQIAPETPPAPPGTLANPGTPR